jgi:hypothetical protein
VTGEQVAQPSLVDVRLPGQISTCPAAEDSLTIDCRDVDGPLRRPSQSDMLRRRLANATNAMEGTVFSTTSWDVLGRASTRGVGVKSARFTSSPREYASPAELISPPHTAGKTARSRSERAAWGETLQKT